MHINHNSKDIDNRLATIEGHIRGIRQMLADGKECEDILLQLSATSGAIKKLSKKILIEHFNTCVIDSVKTDQKQDVDDFVQVLEKYL